MRGARLLPLLAAPWAIEARAAAEMRAMLDRWARYETPDPVVLDRVHADSENRRRRKASISSQTGSVAVVGIWGILTQKGNMLDEVSGGGSASTEVITGVLREALSDDSVSSILLDIDSPGGSVYGIQELADEIYGARSRKPVTAIANSLAASAAYWLGSQCNEFYVTPSGEVGSIGVIAGHTDVSKANEQDGVKVTIITAGQFKGELNPNQPLTDEARAYEQGRVDDYYGMFTRAVARGRGISVVAVRGASFGEGRVLGASDAAKAGMVDGIKTFDDALARARQLARSPSPTVPRGAARSDAGRLRAEEAARRLRIAEL